jgi:hypothetical protein
VIQASLRCDVKLIGTDFGNVEDRIACQTVGGRVGGDLRSRIVAPEAKESASDSKSAALELNSFLYSGWERNRCECGRAFYYAISFVLPFILSIIHSAPGAVSGRSIPLFHLVVKQALRD